jgi:hypothetical protein
MKQNLASLLLIGLLAACAQGQFVDLGSSTQLNGVDPVFGMFGQVETKYNGQLGMYAFWKPNKERLQLLPYPSASLSGINAHCMAGTYTDFQNFNIAGFQQCTDKNGNVQFFKFDFGANATILTTQLHGSQTVVGYFDNFHLVYTGLIATPVFDSNGAVRYYNSTNYSVPGALSTQLLTADKTQIAGSYEASTNHWSGFIQQTSGGPITVVNFPGASNTGVTALGSKCYAGYYDMGDGAHHGFVHCSGFVPLDIGYGGTWITEIRDNGDVVGYFNKSQGGYRGFIWKGLAR